MIVEEAMLSHVERATVKLMQLVLSSEQSKNIAIVFFTAHFVRNVKEDVKRYGYKEIEAVFYGSDQSYTWRFEEVIRNYEILILSCYTKNEVEDVLTFAPKE